MRRLAGVSAGKSLAKLCGFPTDSGVLLVFLAIELALPDVTELLSGVAGEAFL